MRCGTCKQKIEAEKTGHVMPKIIKGKIVDRVIPGAVGHCEDCDETWIQEGRHFHLHDGRNFTSLDENIEYS